LTTFITFLESFYNCTYILCYIPTVLFLI